MANYNCISEMPPDSSAKGFRVAIGQSGNADELCQKLFDAVQSCKKGEIALDVLFHCDPAKLVVPSYIMKGLEGLQTQFDRKQEDLLATSSKAKA
ncbi:hypothetical protein HOV93_40350 [Planctomycetes bacterium FF15]|uniref:Uncharacterized protein n=1 Tax=Bremerella alba TaxID=980252 RepID=A0A7V9A8W3_9BACT|nr:hypothetical protein [Bremerella alba]